jgi:hypothetical protein
LEGLVEGKKLVGLGKVLPDVEHVLAERPPQGLLHVVEVGPQVVDAQGACEIRFISSSEEFGHVPEITQPVVDRRGSEHVERLGPDGAVKKVVESVVAGGVPVYLGVASTSRIAEVMRLVDEDDIRKFCDAEEPFGEVALSVQVRVIEHCQVAEVRTAANATDVR